MFALCLFRNEVWQKWCQTGQAVSIAFWTTARGRFDSHASVKSEIHIFSVMVMQNFLAAMRRQTAGTPIDQQLNR